LSYLTRRLDATVVVNHQGCIIRIVFLSTHFCDRICL
jgi:hypothetical protein